MNDPSVYPKLLADLSYELLVYRKTCEPKVVAFINIQSDLYKKLTNQIFLIFFY